MLSGFSCVLIFVTLWTVACQAPLFLRFSRHDYWSGLPCPPPGAPSDPGVEPPSLMSPELAVRFFITHATWDAPFFLFSSVQSLSHGQLFVTPWTAACQTSLSISNSWSLLKLMSIESMMPSNHLIHCHPLLLSPSIFPSIRVFSNESVLHIRWLKDWSFSFSISPSNEYSGLISFSIICYYFLPFWRLSFHLCL